MIVGVKKDAGKIRFGLIPPLAERYHAAVLTRGAAKYTEYKPCNCGATSNPLDGHTTECASLEILVDGDDNWRYVQNWRSKYYDALRRHLNEWRGGQRIDPEFGLPTLAHAMCCLSFLLELDELEAEPDRSEKLLQLLRDTRSGPNAELAAQLLDQLDAIPHDR